MSEIDVSDIRPAVLLRGLYNASKVMGMGRLAAKPGDMTLEEAEQMMARYTEPAYFDYLYGRILKVWIGRPYLDGRLYDRDLGPGAAEAVVRSLRYAKEEAKVDF